MSRLRPRLLLDGDGTIVARIDLPWGSGPHSVALSRDQSTALVTLHRAASVAMIDVDSHTLSHILAPTFWSPTGICWTEDGDDKAILTAVHVHDPSSGNAYGDTTYFLSELSNDLLVLASSTPAVKPTGADDDGELALTDGIRILNVLFLGQGEIAPPGFEDCGEDPTAEEPPLPTCVYEAC